MAMRDQHDLFRFRITTFFLASLVIALIAVALRLWISQAQGNAATVANDNVTTIELSSLDREASILPRGTKMTRTTIVGIHGSLVGSECIELRVLQADNNCHITKGSELSVGRGLRIGLSRTTPFELNVVMDKSYTNGSVYVDFSVDSSPGRLVGVGRPLLLLLSDSDMSFQMAPTQILNRDRETVIFVASSSSVSLDPLATLEEVRQQLACPYLVVVAKYGECNN